MLPGAGCGRGRPRSHEARGSIMLHITIIVETLPCSVSTTTERHSSILAIIASANCDVLTSFAPVISRAKS